METIEINGIEVLQISNPKGSFYQFSINNFCVTYLQGSKVFSVMNYETKKQAKCELSDKNKNIETVIKKMKGFTFEGKRIRCDVLDILN